ncbi:hypothetical protein EGW08_014260 [Elysia chlorotica]|uniref:Uncharacterized protein n=1 Tax=Elysia chlorotica TaxID=188477 RepID=A0A3S1BD78_ELYCH|nr:hypothetical protein EGW08_014260 [Elysia chlorotica]
MIARITLLIDPLTDSMIDPSLSMKSPSGSMSSVMRAIITSKMPCLMSVSWSAVLTSPKPGSCLLNWTTLVISGTIELRKCCIMASGLMLSLDMSGWRKGKKGNENDHYLYSSVFA